MTEDGADAVLTAATTLGNWAGGDSIFSGCNAVGGGVALATDGNGGDCITDS